MEVSRKVSWRERVEGVSRSALSSADRKFMKLMLDEFANITRCHRGRAISVLPAHVTP